MTQQREACDKWHSDVGPRIHIILEKNKVESSKCVAHYAGEKMFQVEHMGGVQFVVDLAKHTCTCRRWNLTGIPCGHAIASICRRNEDPVTYIHSCYKKASWKRAYGPFLRPMANEELWTRTNLPPILPPVYHKQPGRPKKVRAREPDEKPAAPTGTRLSRSFHVKIKCKVCGEEGHNRLRHRKEGTNSSNQEPRDQPSSTSAPRGQPNSGNKTTQPSYSMPMESQPISSMTIKTTKKYRLK
ncbi:uncharacterized protein LOC126587470 isoform X1 [Malus sylvestris]|uniref:uncharacterized protein LOC126587470 isoform X1 n=1 Tax=Malus sylvestris TaxID=3752 RepID=UPI0021ABCAD3|nr:uncharacterized protein LOC126587470 isoform X1 [Malus sylvestris]